MTDRREEQLAAATGFVFVAGLIAAVLVVPESPPDAGASPAEIASYYTDNRNGILIGTYLTGFAALFGLWFIGSLRSFLVRAEGGTGRLSAVGFGSGLVGGAMILLATAVSSGLAFSVAQSGDEATVRAMYDLTNMVQALGAFPIAGWLAATAIVALRTRALPAWYGVVTDVLALAFIPVGSAIYSESGILAANGGYGLIVIILFVLWVLLTTVYLILRAGTEPMRLSTEPVELPE